MGQYTIKKFPLGGEIKLLHQVKMFESEEKINEWLKNNSKLCEIVDIKFQHSPATYYRFLVHYTITK